MTKNRLAKRVRLLKSAAFYLKIIRDGEEGGKRIRNGFKDANWN